MLFDVICMAQFDVIPGSPPDKYMVFPLAQTVVFFVCCPLSNRPIPSNAPLRVFSSNASAPAVYSKLNLRGPPPNATFPLRKLTRVPYQRGINHHDSLVWMSRVIVPFINRYSYKFIPDYVLTSGIYTVYTYNIPRDPITLSEDDWGV